MMRYLYKRTPFLLCGVLCVLTTFSQNARVVFKSNPVFKRFPAELLKETKYDMILPERMLSGDSLVFELEVAAPEGEYYRLYDWGGLNLFVKPGNKILVDYNSRERWKTRFEGDLSAENAWLNQSCFLSGTMLYPAGFTDTLTYQDFRRQVFANVDSLKRTMKRASASKTFIAASRIRLDFLALGTLMNYYQTIAYRKKNELMPANFEVWHESFKGMFLKDFLKDARRICRRYNENDVLGYRQVTQAILGIVYLAGTDFVERMGYHLFNDEYALVQLLNDPTRLYSQELLELPAQVSDSVVLRVVNELISEKRNLLTGADVMDFEFRDTSGNVHKLSDYKGEPLYIDVWATWCNPCKALAPAFHELAVKFQGKNIRFISISIDKWVTPWLKYLREKDVAKNMLEMHTGDKAFRKKYLISGIPRFILIDKDFKIRAAFAPTPTMDGIETLLEQVVNE